MKKQGSLTKTKSSKPSVKKTDLPPKKVLQEKLHGAVKRARKRLEIQSE